jgi:CRP/FNR family transcriptional regulator, cyclic AMP receptor protein
MMAYVFPHRVHNPHAGALRPPPRPLPDAAIGGIGTVTPPLLSRPPLLPGLRPVESQRIEQGAWFAGLSASLRGAILAEARVQHVKRGTRLVERGSVATDWVGVASGALGLSTSWRDGRAFTMELLGPGDWYGDIALVDHSPVDLDIVAQAHSTVLLVPLASLQQLMNSQPELRHALLQLDCRRLRHMFRRLEELQTLPLSQRVAIKLQRLLKQFGRPPVMGVVPTQARMIAARSRPASSSTRAGVARGSHLLQRAPQVAQPVGLAHDVRVQRDAHHQRRRVCGARVCSSISSSWSTIICAKSLPSIWRATIIGMSLSSCG